jgi:hypothetical protein
MVTNGEDLSREINRDRLIFDLIASRHQREFERTNILDKKASQIIGFVGIIFSLFVGFYALIIKEMAGNEKIVVYYSSWRILVILAIFTLALSIICSVKTLYVKRFFDAPDTEILINDYAKAEKDIPTILRDVGTEISNAVVDNKNTNDYKAEFLKYSMASFAFGMVLIMLFIAGLLIV